MKEIVLPSGRRATIKEGKGRDLLNAQRKAKTADEIIYALIAEITTVDGKQIVYEDVLEMDLVDVLALQAAFTEAFGNFQLSSLNTSSSFQEQQAGDSMKLKK